MINLTQKDLRSIALTNSKRITGKIKRGILTETGYNIEDLRQCGRNIKPHLNQGQHQVYQKPIDFISKNNEDIFFLNSPVCTGNTFVTNIFFLSAEKIQKIVALSEESSGIDGTLLPGGRTAHITFKLSLDVNYNEALISKLKRGTNLAKQLEETSFIVLDKSHS